MLRTPPQKELRSADAILGIPEAERVPSYEAGQADPPKAAYFFFKRVQDILLSFVGMIVLIPAYLLIAAIIVIDDPQAGPLFIQKRVGKDGKEFCLFKFRTMIPHAEEHLSELQGQNEKDGPVFKIRDDPRITRVGKFLRRHALDELPQFWNVLRGDMSLVGPRPPLPREVAQYNAYQWQRLCVKPGLTCYWQIQPRRDDIMFDDWMKLDFKYIREQSFLVDWKILIGTVGAVLRGGGR